MHFDSSLDSQMIFSKVFPGKYKFSVNIYKKLLIFSNIYVIICKISLSLKEKGAAMKQYQIVYNGKENFLNELQQFRQKWEIPPKMTFQIFSEILEEGVINEISRRIEQVFPETPWFGCSTSGNLVNCGLSPDIIVVATVFENESSQFRIFQFDTGKNSVESITRKITENARECPWLRAIELYFTIPEGSTTKFCDGLNDILPDVHIFGGVSCSDDITSDDSCVFSSVGGFSENAILVVFYGGDDFYVDSIRITGWKPLGRKFRVTKSEGSLLQELDGIPAYDLYFKYLHINNDENFFYNTLEFPLFYEHNDTTILRLPVASNADRSLSMSSDIEVGSTVRISYGDPKTIVESIAKDSQRIRKFRPDLLHIFSCAARRTFWTANESTYELEPFKDIAPSVGFFSHGEFLRAKGRLNQHNVTLVIAAMREGEAEMTDVQSNPESRAVMSKVPLVSRLATFISATSLELEEMNSRLEIANKNLKSAAITDGLTGLFNRAETQRRIEQSLSNMKNEKFSLIMMDIDHFKQVNDTYGHQQGDSVIIALANILHNEQLRSSSKFSAGRWGGEEFMLVLPDADISTASLIAELIRQCFENTAFPSMRSQTISLGVTQAVEGDTIDSLCTRVDSALYRAKKAGRNKVIVA